MKIKIYLMFLLSIVLFQSCAGSIKTAAVASSDQKVDYNGSVISEKKHVVTLTHYTEIEHVKNKIIFNLLVQNRGQAPLSIGNENISIIFREKGKDTVPEEMVIQPFDDFMKDLEKDYFDEEIRLITDQLRRIPKTADDIDAKEEDRDKKMIADMFASRFIMAAYRLEEAIEDYDQLEDILPHLVFKPQIIMPNKSINGLIVCDIADIDKKAEGDFNIVVLIEGEKHNFTFSRSM
jgi:hypothetical protein